MIVLRDTESDLYEEALFLLKEEAMQNPPSEARLIEEANRILSRKSLIRKSRSGASMRDGVTWYLLGLFSGAGFIFLLSVFA